MLRWVRLRPFADLDAELVHAAAVLAAFATAVGSSAIAATAVATAAIAPAADSAAVCASCRAKYLHHRVSRPAGRHGAGGWQCAD